jgi:hypothetical protein
MIDTLSTDKRPVKFSEFTKEIAGGINQHFSNRFYWVIAEITSHKFIEKSGYHFFELSEKHGTTNSSVLKCPVMYLPSTKTLLLTNCH